MLLVGDKIRSSFVIQGTVRASSIPSSSSSSSPSSPSIASAVASVSIVTEGGGGSKNGVRVIVRGRGRIAADVKCKAHQEVVGVIPTAERNQQLHVVLGVKELERSSRRDDDELVVLPPLPAAAATGAGIAPPRFESAAHQLEISLHDLRLLSRQSTSPVEMLPSSEEGRRERGNDDDNNKPSSSAFEAPEMEVIPDETSNETTPLTPSKPPLSRPKKLWQGVCRRRRMPPQPPWSTDDFILRAKLILQSVLSESESIANEKGNGNHHRLRRRLVIEDILNSWLGKITRVELTMLMKDLGFRRQSSLALEVFFWMQKQKRRLKPSAHVYSAILGVLGRAGMISEAWEIFDSAQVRSLQSVYIYNSMMGAYLKCGNFQRAWELYEDLRALGLEADEITFNTLLSGIARAGSDMPLKTAAAAEKLFTQMKLAGIPPGRFTYNILIMVFSKCGNLEGAAAVLEEMRATNQTPDLYTYNTIIGMYGRAGKCNEALQIYDLLRGSGFYPDVVTYTHLMQMFSRAQNLEAAIGQFSEMQRVGCKPDFMTYSLLVHIYGGAGLAAEAEHAFKRMQEAGFKPTTVTWSSLIQAYGKRGMLEKVSSCFAEMLKSGCQPDASLFNIMMMAYRQAELPIHAASLFRRMQSQGVKPNAACFNTLIHAFSENGHREDAKAWHEQMIRSGFAPDKLSRRLLNNLSPSRRNSNRDTRRSVKAFHSIQSMGVPPI
ncbi:unnamed protein product [Calypogeia fissa]